MDGLQVTNAPQEKQAVSSLEPDKYTHSQTHAYPSNSHPVASSYQEQTLAQPYHNEKPLPSDSRQRIPFGLSIVAYSVLVAALMLIICGAAFGGALGAVAARKGKDCSPSDNASIGANSTSPTATATTTVFSIVTGTSSSSSTPTTASGLVADYIPLAPSQVGTAALNCTSGSSVFAPSGSQFQLNCNVNYIGNDIGLITTYRLEDCVGACANLNILTGTTSCLGVLFNANMQDVVSKNGGNWWLESKMENAAAEGTPPSVGAVLVASA
ncbi:hypothetical protein H2200_000226 [Cladophialophora chaetospira]|uniref:Apple domain-containing protein n=1 Tax=Cladophialophora chaetospira TaxID=386627 RepID=A0AA38XN49_9EURO|nr:hypothetical protein H2200_000226 [Cladophialophora chaetospira]